MFKILYICSHNQFKCSILKTNWSLIQETDLTDLLLSLKLIILFSLQVKK